MMDAVSTLEWAVSDGLVAYQDALDAMQARVAAIRDGVAPEQVWLLEHAPLYTSGTSARPEDLRNPRGFPVFAAGRGGQWTYHGPGQRIIYTMLDLTQPHGRGAAPDGRAFVQGRGAW